MQMVTPSLIQHHRTSSRPDSYSPASVVPVNQLRRKSIAVDANETPPSPSSTTTTSTTGHARNRASSGAVLPNLSYQARAGSPRQSSPAKKRRASSRADITSSLNALPPLHSTPALSDPNGSSTVYAISTPVSSSLGQDYFGEDGVSPRSLPRGKRPSASRSHNSSTSVGSAARMQAAQDASEAREATFGGRDSKFQRDVDARMSPDQQQGNDVPAPADENSRKKQSRASAGGEKDKKAMLSKALQKANTAVLLDNAQNYQGALDAYDDACRLLQQVMSRSSGIEDKRKLDAIRVTYTNRIEELRQLEASQSETPEEKSLPARPMSDDSLGSPKKSPSIDTTVKTPPTAATTSGAEETAAPKLAYAARDRDSFFSGTMQAVDDSSRREEDAREAPPLPRPSSTENTTAGSRSTPVPQEEASAGEKKTAGATSTKTNGVHLPPPENTYMPAPLSFRSASSSPKRQPETEEAKAPEPEVDYDEENAVRSGPDSNAPASWLDTIDESGSACSSPSVHSMSSEQGLRRKHLRGISGDTNPDFDAAFDAAVEAAYDQGFEPDMEERRREREPAPLNKGIQKNSILVPANDFKEILSPTNTYHPSNPLNPSLDDEEEERLLDDITQDYAQSFNFDVSSKSALPRQSGSSGYSRSTWQSSQVSDRTTAGTSLSTVAEKSGHAPVSPKAAFAASTSLNSALSEAPPVPAPQMSLPKPPGMGQNRASGVRGRRLSGQQMKQLKIETSAKGEPRKRSSTFHHSASPFQEEHDEAKHDKDSKFGTELRSTPSDQRHENILKSPPSLDVLSAVSDASRPLTATTATNELRKSVDELNPQKPPLYRKNKSSVSLREHTLILSSPTVDAPPQSAVTPMSSSFMPYASKRNNSEAPLSSQRAKLPSFGSMASDNVYSGGIYLFDTSLSQPQPATSPRSPQGFNNLPSLEPCPESALLRPFWLMRAIASTLTHPKGGYVTTRLFVPREVWQTRGVKLKSVEDKIANCDLLTAALGRLAGVDTYDADAVMEELQNFEEVMERVQSNFVKKLGSDVGISGLAGIFKEASGVAPPNGSNTPGGDTTSGQEKTRSKESKGGYLTSWRKLRSKSSGTAISTSQARQQTAAAEKGGGEVPTMPSVPMTSFVPVERRGQKKDARNLTFDGPHKEYMGSLARLFEGVQVLDQIARQVEDPGLKGSSPTHVGLELSIRHAGEFFGFYVCRFVLADLGVLVDKFIKRGTEWVLA